MAYLTSDFETLAKTFDLETSGTKASATMIFQLLLLKHGRRNAFAWYDHENCFGGDDWLNCEIQSTIHNGNSIRLEELKEVAESFGFSLIRERKRLKMEFNHEMIKKEVSVDDTIIQNLEGRNGFGWNCHNMDFKKRASSKHRSIYRCEYT